MVSVLLSASVKRVGVSRMRALLDLGIYLMIIYSFISIFSDIYRSIFKSINYLEMYNLKVLWLQVGSTLDWEGPVDKRPSTN